MKYLKSILWIFVPLLVLSFLFNIFYYFDWLKTSVYSFLEFLSVLLSFFAGGIYLGKHSLEKGWLEGMKLGGMLILFLFCVSYLAFGIGFSFKGLIYYLLLLIVTTFGSMVGIRNVDTNQNTNLAG